MCLILFVMYLSVAVLWCTDFQVICIFFPDQRASEYEQQLVSISLLRSPVSK